MSFFKRFIPLKGKVWIDFEKPGFQEGEDVAGKLSVEARESFQATEVRVEARAVEDWTEVAWVERGNPPQRVQEHRSRVDTLFSRDVRLLGPGDFGAGPARAFQFRVNIPPYRPAHGGSVRYTVKGVVAVKGRPDMTGDASISFVPPVPIPVVVPSAPTDFHSTPISEMPVSRPQPPPRLILATCPECDAPLKPDPEDVTLTCVYCGSTIGLSGEAVRHSMIAASVAGTEAMKTAQEFTASSIFVTRGMVDRGEWGDIKLYYVPVWLIPVTLTGSLLAKRAIVSSEGTASKAGQKVGMAVLGGFLKQYGLGEVAKGVDSALDERADVSEVMDIPVVGRRGTMFQPDPGKYEMPIGRKQAFQRTSDEVLNADFSRHEAAERAESLALEKVRSRYVSVSSFNVSAQASEGELVHAPFWFVKYSMRDKPHVVVIDALSGSVVAGQRPWILR